jgi:hypothetical protein
MVQEAHVSTANLSFLSVSVRSLAFSVLLSERQASINDEELSNIKSMFLYIDIMEFTCFSEEIYVSMVSGNDDFFVVFLHSLHENRTQGRVKRRYKLEYGDTLKSLTIKRSNLIVLKVVFF